MAESYNPSKLAMDIAKVVRRGSNPAKMTVDPLKYNNQ